MKISKRMWKHFNLKMKPEVTQWRKSHTHKPWGERNLRELRDWFPCKYLIYRRPRLMSWQMKTIQESLPVHSQASQFTAWTLARPPLFALKVKSESRSVVSDSLLDSPWNSPGQNTGVSSLFLFPTQGSNPGLPYCRQILYQLSHKGSPSLALKYSPPQTLNRFTGSLLQQVFPEVQFLCYSRMNAISGHLSLPFM